MDDIQSNHEYKESVSWNICPHLHIKLDFQVTQILSFTFPCAKFILVY